MMVKHSTVVNLPQGQFVIKKMTLFEIDKLIIVCESYNIVIQFISEH